MVFTTKQLENKRFKIESILRFRYQSFVKLISQYYNKSTEHEESAAHHNPCIECYKNNMYMRYYQKKLELEFSEGIYFERYLDLVNHKKTIRQLHPAIGLYRLEYHHSSGTHQKKTRTK